MPKWGFENIQAHPNNLNEQEWVVCLENYSKLRDSCFVAGERQIQEGGKASNAASFIHRELLMHDTVAMGYQQKGDKARSLEEDPWNKYSKGYPEWTCAQIQAWIPAPKRNRVEWKLRKTSYTEFEWHNLALT